MAQVTVQQLAEVVGATADRLLAQMKEAGLPHTEAEQAVSNEDKQTLLAFLKASHGESTSAPRRITLKRKTLSTLRTPGAQGRKTVNVEVRKKRTYVKRDPAELLAEAQAVAAEAEDTPVEDAVPAEGLAVEAEATVEVAVEETVAVPEPEPEPVVPAIVDEFEEDPATMDPELLRQRAIARRQHKEAEETESRKLALEARKAERHRKKPIQRRR